ncbi:MAG: glycosyltransferase family 2 protein [Lachnospiraceae bacterium]|nr:glycosyltransferase family 2 protein [Lachnospiraceae bacterium]
MKIQILLATHNGEKYVGTQLDSLIAQQLRPEDHYSILISDDTSSDGTTEIIREYQERYPSVIEILPSQVSGSAKDNFIRLMGASDGDIVFFCDQDDWWLPDKVLKTAEAFKDAGRPELVYSDVLIADENLKTIEIDERRLQTYTKGLTLKKLLVQNYIMGCTLAVNRTLLNGVLRDDYPGIEMHDWWLAIYAETFGEIIHVPEKLMKYRQHSDNEVGAKDLKDMKYIRSHLNGKMLRENCGSLIKQARGFYDCYGDLMTPEKRRVFREFFTLRDKNKLSRIMTQIKGGYLKSTAVRVIGQLLYM